ncbi:hypothetical protein Rsub_09769 [Raphidocelis subcapitata]|uniref:Autophagy-related protein 13 N-terminal domain-containing protein n=1 Tax=Raphidocelis subcapitata TaxID=307507 RepID=A0A2V0PDD1_9CHLO|nr:hypothetical protein Rsub_09769 [Raphidocelis subcapitata]|eukprot:GBF96972.1 hypothetical protein Rsub_09769 [Raphidocelis subcapitata]
MAERLTIEHYVGECCLKCAQVVLAARIPRDQAAIAPSDRRAGRWFLLEVDEVPGLAKQLEAWRRDITQALVIEVYATHAAPAEPLTLEQQLRAALPGGTPEGAEVLLERWTLRYAPLQRGAGSGQAGARAGGSDDAAVYKRMILLVRSLHSYVRVLPAYRLYRAARRAPGLGVSYRVSVVGADGAPKPIGAGAGGAATARPPAAPAAPPPRLRASFSFSPVDTPGGAALAVGVEYAPPGAVALLEAAAGPRAQHSAPRIIPDYVGAGGALLADRAAGSGSAGRGSPACARSAPGGGLLGSGGALAGLVGGGGGGGGGGSGAGSAGAGGSPATAAAAGGSPHFGAAPGAPPIPVGSAGSGGAGGPLVAGGFSGSPLQLPRAASLRSPVVRQSWGSREVRAHVVVRGFSAPGDARASAHGGHRRSSSSGSAAAAGAAAGPGAAGWPAGGGAGASALGTSPAGSAHQLHGRPPLPAPASPACGGVSSASPTTPVSSLPRPSPLGVRASSSFGAGGGGGPPAMLAASPPTPQHGARGGGVPALGSSAPAHAGLPPSGHRTPHGASPHQSPRQQAGSAGTRGRHAPSLPHHLTAQTRPPLQQQPAGGGAGAPRPAAAPATILKGFEPVPAAGCGDGSLAAPQRGAAADGGEDTAAASAGGAADVAQGGGGESAAAAGSGILAASGGAGAASGSAAGSASGLDSSGYASAVVAAPALAGAAALPHSLPASAPVAIPGRGPRGRARSVADLAALGAAAAGGEGGISRAMARAAGEGGGRGRGGGNADGTASGDEGDEAALSPLSGLGGGALGRLRGRGALAPSSAPAAPRGMLGQLLAQGAPGPLTLARQGLPGCTDREAAQPVHDAVEAGGPAPAEAEAAAGGAAGQQASDGEGQATPRGGGGGGGGGGAIVVRAHAAPLAHHRLTHAAAAGSRSPAGLPAPAARYHPHRLRGSSDGGGGGAGGAGGGGSFPDSPLAHGAGGPLSASPQLPFAFTPSGASVKSLVEQHRWGGAAAAAAGGAPPLLPQGGLASLAQAAAAAAAPAAPLCLPPPSPPVSGRDITALATIRRPSWSGRSGSLIAASASAAARGAAGAAPPSPGGGGGASGGGLSASPGGCCDDDDDDDLLGEAGLAALTVSGDGADAPADAPAPGPAAGDAGPWCDEGLLGPDESASEVLPFAIDSDAPAAAGAARAGAGAARSASAAPFPAGAAAPPGAARDLAVCAFIRCMQDAPPLASRWAWGGGGAAVGDAVFAVEALAARLGPALLPPPPR